MVGMPISQAPFPNLLEYTNISKQVYRDSYMLQSWLSAHIQHRQYEGLIPSPFFFMYSWQHILTSDRLQGRKGLVPGVEQQKTLSQHLQWRKVWDLPWEMAICPYEYSTTQCHANVQNQHHITLYVHVFWIIDTLGAGILSFIGRLTSKPLPSIPRLNLLRDVACRRSN